MNEKMVFLDIDGTILNGQNQIPPSTKYAIKKMKDQGIHVAIATGRGPTWFKHILNELDLFSYVSFNGSYVVFEGETLFSNPLDRKHLIEFEQVAKTKGEPMVFLNQNHIYANHPNHHYIQDCIGTMNFEHPPHHETFHHENDVFQALLFIEQEKAQWYYEKKHFDYVRWHQNAIDVLPLGGSKAKGIEALLRVVNIPRENTFAFGDGLNDIEMLEYVGYGVAMGNAVTEAKDVAKYVTGHVEEDGLYNGLVKVGLLKE
ncbi:Cof-type HAD-IIB family hydrolase [Evansella tamaricis]|uniref:Cof-type HAD-IIB family hydrolase n=1 Tax=Evansella tamaricis TaxID=2069301 RepID=A0ABS6JD50_9BACI|nr:Cof-type HAD-IIB family hydrolase [Evansella tamaricis]MBU9710273.1 Cof-type HAD-IIB family hydrolase [Evansella tamaricis]